MFTKISKCPIYSTLFQPQFIRIGWYLFLHRVFFGFWSSFVCFCRDTVVTSIRIVLIFFVLLCHFFLQCLDSFSAYFSLFQHHFAFSFQFLFFHLNSFFFISIFNQPFLFPFFIHQYILLMNFCHQFHMCTSLLFHLSSHQFIIFSAIPFFLTHAQPKWVTQQWNATGSIDIRQQVFSGLFTFQQHMVSFPSFIPFFFVQQFHFNFIFIINSGQCTTTNGFLQEHGTPFVFFTQTVQFQTCSTLNDICCAMAISSPFQ